MTGALRRLWSRCLAVAHRRSLDRDLQEELASHLELAAQDHIDRGLPAAEARRIAAIKLGAISAAREGHREARGLPSLDSLMSDLGQAFRGMRREPGFTLIALCTLALAIGANTAVFSIVNPLLLRPLPFAESDRLMWVTDPAAAGGGLEGPTYRVEVFEEIAAHNRAFEQLTSYVAFFGRGRFTLTGKGVPQRLSAVPVGPRFFETLGVQPRLGRLFTAEEVATHGPRVAILTDRLWRRQFAGDPQVVGQAMTINNEATTIVGVLPDTFDFAATFAPGVQVDFFVPAVLDDMRSWGNVLAVVGRLKHGVSQELARADFADLVPRLKDSHPEWRSWVPVVAVPVDLKTHVTGRMRRPLVALWAAVALVLLIACANLSNLLLARTATRGKEIAVRMALGAGRRRVLRQLLTEGVVLSLCGAALGIPLAYGLTISMRDSAALAMPLLHHVRVDGAALIFTLACASVAGLAFGVLPALRVSGRDLHSVLKERNRGSTDGRSHATLRSALVVAEVALACVLLVGTGLLLRSFLHLLDTDLGFAPSRAFAVRIDTPEGLSDSHRRARLDDMLRRVRASPGIEAAGLTDALPLERPRAWGVGVEGQRYQGQDWVTAFVYVTGPGYLPAMRIPLLAGREFAEDDSADRQPVMMINASLARVLWPGRAIAAAVGQLVKVYGPFKEPVRVIGVVADTRHSGADQAPATQMYVAHSQLSATTDLVVRSPLQPDVVAYGLRATIAMADSGMVVTDVRPIEDLVERAVSPRRFLVTMVAGFSLLALTLASLGIYGVVSYTVNQRGQDIAVRMALGATSGAVSRQVLSGTLRLALVGVAVGLALSAVVARAIASLLFNTSPLDASTFAGTALVLIVVALTAGAIPAMRAARTDPATALRAD